jgi:pimeloyl-ACP methyl ester carboxylesterase
MRLSLAVVATLAFTLAACGSRSSFDDWAGDASAFTAASDAGPVDGSAADIPTVAPGRAPVTLAWGACSRAYNRADECATFNAPLLGDDMSRTVSVHIAHIKSATVGAPQIWMLQGGPGGSAVDMVELAKQYMQGQLPDAEYFAIDHRGTGLSSGLTCAASEAAACVSQLDAKWSAGGLSGFSTSQAARDVDQAIASTRAPSQKVFLYGVSYGTYWAHRVLQVAQQPIDGAILDSFAIPTSTFANTNKFFDDVFKTLVEACVKLDATCAAKLGGNPWQFVETAMKAHKAGTLCKEAGLSHNGLKNGLSTLMQYEEVHGLLPALIYRLARCSAEDQRVLLRVDLGEPTGTSFDSDEQFSTPLYYNVVMGELWPVPTPTRAALSALADSMTIATTAVAEFPSIAASWPRYPSDPSVGNWYTGAVPVLTLNSALDVQTPAAESREVATHLVAAGQTYVEFPYNNHGVILDDTGCATSLIRSFMQSPSAKLNTSCTAKTAPPRFTDDGTMRTYFNVNATWKADVSTPPTDVAHPRPRFRFTRPNAPFVKGRFPY